MTACLVNGVGQAVAIVLASALTGFVIKVKTDHPL